MRTASRHTYLTISPEELVSRDLKFLDKQPKLDTNVTLAEYLSPPWHRPDRRSLLCGSFGCLASALHYLHRVADVPWYEITPGNVLVSCRSGADGKLLLSDRNVHHIPCMSAQNGTPKHRSCRADEMLSLGAVFLEITRALDCRNPDYERPRSLGTDWPRNPGDSSSPLMAQRCINVDTNVGFEPYVTKPLDWAKQMMVSHSDDRPSAEELYQMVAKSDSQHAGACYFGTCCRARMEVEESNVHLAGRIEPLEDHTPGFARHKTIWSEGMISGATALVSCLVYILFCDSSTGSVSVCF